MITWCQASPDNRKILTIKKLLTNHFVASLGRLAAAILICVTHFKLFIVPLAFWPGAFIGFNVGAGGFSPAGGQSTQYSKLGTPPFRYLTK